jgi:hypothetical protein
MKMALKSSLCVVAFATALSGCASIAPLEMTSIGDGCQVLYSAGTPVIKKFAKWQNAYGVGQNCPKQLPDTKIDIVKSSNVDLNSTVAVFTTYENAKGVRQKVIVRKEIGSLVVVAHPIRP